MEGLKLVAPENEEIFKDSFMCIAKDGKGLDNIFQFFSIKVKDFPQILAEVIEDYFGDTSKYALEYVPELKMYGLLAKDQRDNPLYSKKFHIHGFLTFLDNTIKEIQKSAL